MTQLEHHLPVLQVAVPMLLAPMLARVALRLSEGSGRPVERRLTRAVAASGPMIGIRPSFDDVLPEGGTAACTHSVWCTAAVTGIW